MKVILFCGGLGTRLREYSETIPKPMVEIGYRPIIWHLMKYYAHYGHKEFILCLGYRSDYIKNYFLKYDECLSNDFVLSKGGQEIHLYNSDISEWTITFVDTGLNANIGQRLKAVERYLGDDEVFMANYTDGLADLPLPAYIDSFYKQDKIGCFMCARPSQTFHLVSADNEGLVTSIEPIETSEMYVNGGYFIFKRDLFKYINDGEELVCEPFQRLIAEKQLVTYRHNGFWLSMDTFKEKKLFDELYVRGERPWAVWEDYPSAPPHRIQTQIESANGKRMILDRSHLVTRYRPSEVISPGVE
jgi:glucose-1-phosphate cytidylyltransferase